VTFTPGRELLISLHRVRWVTDARIDGTARWDRPSGCVLARLAVHRRAGPVVRLTARWRPFGGAAPACRHRWGGGKAPAGGDGSGAVIP
jgi:hypothetical protein